MGCQSTVSVELQQFPVTLKLEEIRNSCRNRYMEFGVNAQITHQLDPQHILQREEETSVQSNWLLRRNLHFEAQMRIVHRVSHLYHLEQSGVVVVVVLLIIKYNNMKNSLQILNK